MNVHLRPVLNEVPRSFLYDYPLPLIFRLEQEPEVVLLIRQIPQVIRV